MTVQSGTPDTFPKLLLAHARERGDAPAIREKDLGIWQTTTWAQMRAEVEALAAGLFNPLLYPDQAKDVQLSQEELGYLCNVSRQRVNQALHHLEKVGLVKVDYGRIRILDLEGLRNFMG